MNALNMMTAQRLWQSKQFANAVLGVLGSMPCVEQAHAMCRRDHDFRAGGSAVSWGVRKAHPPLLAGDHLLAAAQRRHAAVQHVQVQLAAADLGHLRVQKSGMRLQMWLRQSASRPVRRTTGCTPP